MNRKMILGLTILSMVMLVGMYVAFLATPPTPALPDENIEAFQYKESPGSKIPNSYVVTYSNPEACVAIVTVRTFAMNDRAYSRLLDQTQPYLEDFAKEKFDEDIDVKFIKEEEVDIHGHDAVRQHYEIRWPEVANVGPIMDHFQEEKDVYASMVLTVWFCHEDFKTICVGYVYLPILQEPTENLVQSIQDVNSESMNLVPFMGGIIATNAVLVVIIFRKKENPQNVAVLRT